MKKRHHHTTEYVMLNTGLCQACWKCVSVCPRQVIGKMDIFFHKHSRIIDPERCTGCRACVKTCPEGAITPLKLARTQSGDASH